MPLIQVFYSFLKSIHLKNHLEVNFILRVTQIDPRTLHCNIFNYNF